MSDKPVRREHLEVAGCTLVADLIDGTGGPILFLHGASNTKADALRVLSAAGVDRPLVMPDSRGHGDSVEGDWSLQSWQQLTDDAVAWLDHVDARDAVVAGVSMGAIIAPAVALARPARVTSLIPIYPVYIANDVAPDPGHEAMLSLLLAAFSVPDIEAILATVGAGAAEADVQMLRERLGLHRDFAGMNAYFQGDRSATSVPYSLAELQSLPIPVTIVGGADPFHPADVARRLASEIEGSTLVELDGVAADAHETAMADAIRAHLDRVK